MTKGWTDERRQKQADSIRQLKPWLKSTGPRTAKGKQASSMNALKHGGRSRLWAYYTAKILDCHDIIVSQALLIHDFEIKNKHFSNELKKIINKNNETSPPPHE